MADSVRCDAERYQTRPGAHGFVGPPPCQPPAPLLPGQAVRDDDLTGLVSGEETGEGIWPAEGTVDTCLIGNRQRCQDGVIIGTADEVRDDSTSVIPFDER